MTHTHKVCACCKKCKPVAEFCKRTASPDGLQGYCKACMSREKVKHRRKQRVATRQKWAAIAQAAARL